MSSQSEQDAAAFTAFYNGEVPRPMDGQKMSLEQFSAQCFQAGIDYERKRVADACASLDSAAALWFDRAEKADRESLELALAKQAIAGLVGALEQMSFLAHTHPHLWPKEASAALAAVPEGLK